MIVFIKVSRLPIFHFPLCALPTHGFISSNYCLEACGLSLHSFSSSILNIKVSLYFYQIYSVNSNLDQPPAFSTPMS